ncbi:diguanylate cyclase (GGDEF)-like protein [Clostridium acetobutylicum]|uniref:Signal transduction protein containing diguanilate cyclase/phosphodiesterase domain (GGDEF) n=1 Tax=Clostridium acetobutylicum (strain ATCC 824 / DSM 792 / JCM 1419 / IAM 19013 / LMG 5710 / NBRC 13948 / NRRL B-527 / VKM B-1787 / 2291 / W) TaxID=272562 RepID=Q97LC6_CLOAB|nr:MULTISPECIES: sensor domain-containing diguanylate cyclase [Clostridium]AAK78613.1 Signal transduction protein containing diguanilate cyclase/phosphodiesterase domain (GGDEF) [Clostridium acetobutylicum ATCC 824]ADZ19687.1 Signal transduction protein containing diguanilate cyclase/phosphodiesterase domain (GGDEF) [Clostridium acetobutylicum EA 2018]AEI33088.1 signal transduction protein [Clostridium acetobutylicum DSM 1731]AWV80337.1 sensor domain-containing diguanylate cyclase [Clostridium 
MDTNYKMLYEKYEKLKNEFSTYQNFAETQIQRMNGKNTELEKKLDILTNVIEVSKYINSNISDDNLVPMINDMIIGILGVTYSTIYLVEDDEKLIVKASNVMDNYDIIVNPVFSTFSDNRPIVINSKEPLFKEFKNKLKVHSIIGVPITLRDNFRGYIIVEHTLYDFFSHGHIKFISSIANQIAIAIENSFLYKKVKESSIKDPFLGIYNRKHFFDMIEGKVAKDSRRSFAIVMLDIDHFKSFNDSYGHQFGDEVLIQTAKILEQSIGEKDEVARYGGEEIVLYLNDAQSKEKVFKTVDGIRASLSNNSVRHGGIEKRVTASFGISYYPQNGETVEKVVSVADAMLYEAKNSGRNKVVSSL